MVVESEASSSALLAQCSIKGATGTKKVKYTKLHFILTCS